MEFSSALQLYPEALQLLPKLRNIYLLDQVFINTMDRHIDGLLSEQAACAPSPLFYWQPYKPTH